MHSETIYLNTCTMYIYTSYMHCMVVIQNSGPPQLTTGSIPPNKFGTVHVRVEKCHGATLFWVGVWKYHSNRCMVFLCPKRTAKTSTKTRTLVQDHIIKKNCIGGLPPPKTNADNNDLQKEGLDESWSLKFQLKCCWSTLKMKKSPLQSPLSYFWYIPGNHHISSLVTLLSRWFSFSKG